MKFEWDERKNQSNIAKHGIDFNDSKFIFEKPLLLRTDDRKNYKEERFIGLGKLEDLVVVLVFTRRKNKIRIISVRKGNKQERKMYYERFEKI